MVRSGAEQQLVGDSGPVQFAAVRVLYNHVMSFEELEGIEKKAYLVVEKISIGEEYELSAEITSSSIFREFMVALQEEIPAP